MKSNNSNSLLDISTEVRSALDEGRPVLALESTILSHGMPYPENLVFARTAEQVVRNAGAVPAVIALDRGRVRIGLTDEELERVTGSGEAVKAGVRDLAWVISGKLLGTTTVSSTIRLAHRAGIQICATGGIGGVHPGFSDTMDISQDIIEMSRTGVLLVASGAKAILDIPKTLEALETYSIPVIGYKTDSFPVFYSRSSDFDITVRADSIEETVQIYRAHIDLGPGSAVMVANPVPGDHAIRADEVSEIIRIATNEAVVRKITGKDLTPFLLKRLHKLSGGRTQTVNQALALSNYKLGARLAVAWSKIQKINKVVK